MKSLLFLLFSVISVFALPKTPTNSIISDREIGNEASVLLCVTTYSSKCGIFATYINGQSRQSVSYQTGGQLMCSIQLLRKHTNDNGFWVNINFIGSAGANIGYDPTGRSIALGVATWSSSDQEHLEARCLNEFGWGPGEVDVDAGSGESAWFDMDQKLY